MSSCLLRRQLQADSAASGHTLLILLTELLGPTKRHLLRHEQASTPAQQEKFAWFSVPIQASSQAAGMVSGWNHTSKESWFLSFPRRAHSQLEAGVQISSVSHCGHWRRCTRVQKWQLLQIATGGLVCFPNAYFVSLCPLPPSLYQLQVSELLRKQESLYNWIF